MHAYEYFASSKLANIVQEKSHLLLSCSVIVKWLILTSWFHNSDILKPREVYVQRWGLAVLTGMSKIEVLGVNYVRLTFFFVQLRQNFEV
jgi:hypothetical protein